MSFFVLHTAKWFTAKELSASQFMILKSLGMNGELHKSKS